MSIWTLRGTWDWYLANKLSYLLGCVWLCFRSIGFIRIFDFINAISSQIEDIFLLILFSLFLIISSLLHSEDTSDPTTKAEVFTFLLLWWFFCKLFQVLLVLSNGFGFIFKDGRGLYKRFLIQQAMHFRLFNLFSSPTFI